MAESNTTAAAPAAEKEVKPWELFPEDANTLDKTPLNSQGGVQPPWIQYQQRVAAGAISTLNSVLPESAYKNFQKAFTASTRAISDPQPTDMNFDNVFSRLVQTESRGQHRDAKGNLTKSPVGALGITQMMPGTIKDPGYGVKPPADDSEGEYLRAGKDYLQAMVKNFKGDYDKALAAYNYGPGNVRKAIMNAAKAGHDDWLSLTPKETQNYVRKIMRGK